MISVNLEKIIQGESAVIFLIPSASYGYIFAKNGDTTMLYAAMLMLVVPAYYAILYSREKYERLSERGHKITAISAYFWIGGVLWGIGSIWRLMPSEDVLIVGGLLGNIGILLLFIAANAREYVIERDIKE